MTTPLRQLKRLVKLRLEEIRDTVGYNIAAMKSVSRIANEKKNEYITSDMDQNANDIWTGMGLGSDVAAALQSKKRTEKQ